MRRSPDRGERERVISIPPLSSSSSSSEQRKLTWNFQFFDTMRTGYPESWCTRRTRVGRMPLASFFSQPFMVFLSRKSSRTLLLRVCGKYESIFTSTTTTPKFSLILLLLKCRQGNLARLPFSLFHCRCSSSFVINNATRII